jgi:hypothetical protein
LFQLPTSIGCKKVVLVLFPLATHPPPSSPPLLAFGRINAHIFFIVAQLIVSYLHFVRVKQHGGGALMVNMKKWITLQGPNSKFKLFDFILLLVYSSCNYSSKFHFFNLMFYFVLLEVWEAKMQSGKQIWSMYVFICVLNFKIIWCFWKASSKLFNICLWFKRTCNLTLSYWFNV